METSKLHSDASQRTDAPSLEEAYLTFRPLFYHALSAVAREGFSVPPSDAKDVMHSFLVDTWSSIEKHYDPSRGALKTYVYTAFKRYARRFAAKRQREVHQSFDRQTLESLAASNPSTPDSPNVESGIDEDRLKRAIIELPDEEAEVLRHYLATLSERQVATELDTTRYHVHRRLVHAIGKLALYFGRQPPGIPSDAWNVTRLVLERGYTTAQAAHLLELPPDRAKRLHDRALSTLLFRVRSMLTHDTSTPTMPETGSTTVHETLARALRNEDVDALREFGDRPDDLLEFIESDQFLELEDLPPKVADAFYKVVARAAEQNEESAEASEIASVTDAEEDAVGVAFEDLIGYLKEKNPHLADFEWLVAEEPDAADNYSEALLSQPSFRRAPDEMRPLAQAGLSPLDVFYGINAVPDLLYRMRDQGLLDSDEAVVLATLRSWKHEPELDVQPEKAELRYFVKEIELSMSCTPETARRFFDWMIRVAGVAAYLFSGHCAYPRSRDGAETAIEMTSCEKEFASLGKQWLTALEHMPA